MKGALDVHRALLAVDVPHEVVRLPTTVATADDLPRALGLEQGCVVVRCYRVTRPAGSSTAAVLVPAGTDLDPGALLTALGATAVCLATPDEVNAATDFAAGLVSPVALPAAVEVLADAAAGVHDVVYTAVGEGGLALGIRSRDLLVVAGARVCSLAPATEPYCDLDGDLDGRSGGRRAGLADVVDLGARPGRRGTR